MNWHKLGGLAIVAALVVGGALGVRYLNGSWAPTSFDGGLYLPEVPKLRDSSGAALSSDDEAEFRRLCSELRSTTRHIGEDRGTAVIRLLYPKTNETEFLTIYQDKNVIVKGWRWIDAKIYSMKGRRAPCYQLSSELGRFIEAHKLGTNDAKRTNKG